MARNNAIRTRLVQIGNSRGVRIPKALIEQAGLGEEVDLQVREGAVIIRSRRRPRAGWAKAMKAMAKRGEDRLLDPYHLTHFDRNEWEW